MKAIALLLVLVAAPVAAQSTRDRVDQGLLIGGLSMSSIALGITMACTSARTCREANPTMAGWIGDSPVKASVVKSAVNGVAYYAAWRVTKGKTRTLLLAGLTAINTWDALHDARVMRTTRR